MKLENEFSVAAPLEQTWATLLDIPRVAGVSRAPRSNQTEPTACSGAGCG